MVATLQSNVTVICIVMSKIFEQYDHYRVGRKSLDLTSRVFSERKQFYLYFDIFICNLQSNLVNCQEKEEERTDVVK